MEISTLNQYLRVARKDRKAIDEIYWEEIWEEYLTNKKNEYYSLNSKELLHRIISEVNYKDRSNYLCCDDLGVRIKIGNICYVDFGVSYINEAGYQHFGLIINIVNGKALVIPMTSNETTYRQAKSKDHLMTIGKINGMNKESVLFLNDARFINTSRIIDVKAYIPNNSKLFKEIKRRLVDLIE